MLERDEDSLTEDARSLLRAARGGEVPTASEYTRIKSALLEQERSLGSQELVRRSSANASPKSIPAWRSRWRATLLAALVVSGSIGAVASPQLRDAVRQLTEVLPSFIQRQSNAEPPSSVGGQSRGSTATSAPFLPPPPQAHDPGSVEAAPNATPSTTSQTLSAAARDRPTETVEPARSGREESSKHSSRANTPNRSIDTELELVVAARDALTRGDHPEVQRLVRVHRSKFEQGELAPEVAGIRALSDCRSGAGSRSAAAYLERYPETLLTPGLRKECRLDAISVPPTPNERTQGTTTRQ